MIKSALDNIQAFFFDKKPVPQCQQLSSYLPRCSMLQLRAIFILLLNIDEKLKEKCSEHANKQHMYKISRFLQDMRKYNIVSFLSNDKESLMTFVDKALETYINA